MSNIPIEDMTPGEVEDLQNLDCVISDKVAETIDKKTQLELGRILVLALALMAMVLVVGMFVVTLAMPIGITKEFLPVASTLLIVLFGNLAAISVGLKISNHDND